MSAAATEPAPDGEIVRVDHLVVEFRATHSEGRSLRRAMHPAVRDVSFALREHSSLALIGESGSGKSTVSLAIAGVGRITSGSVRVIDETLTADRPRLRRRRADVQMVLQDPFSSLDPRQSVVSGLKELRRLHRERTSWIDHRELLDLVRLPATALERRPHELSGGQLQRVAIARALYVRPRVLIADEPTSALDVATQTQILDLLAQLRARFGITLLFVTHDLAVVETVADEVVVLQRGKVVEAGPAASVLQDPQDAYTRSLLAALPGHRLRALRATATPGEGDDAPS